MVNEAHLGAQICPAWAIDGMGPRWGLGAPHSTSFDVRARQSFKSNGGPRSSAGHILSSGEERIWLFPARPPFWRHHDCTV